MGIVLSSKRASQPSQLKSFWLFSWIMHSLKNLIRKAKPYIPDPKRSFESVSQNLQGNFASPSHIWEKIQHKIPDPKAALENIKNKVPSVPDTLSQIKQSLPDVSSYHKAALENLKGKAEVASEAAHKLKEVISDASNSSIAKFENLKEKMESVYHGLKDEVLSDIVSKARSKIKLLSLIPIQIPNRSDVIKTIKEYFLKSVLIFLALYSAKIIISFLLSRFEAFVQWALKKSGEYLLILLKKIWSLILKGIEFIWNKIKQRWQNNDSEGEETDSRAERNPSDHENHHQVHSEGQKVDASVQTDFIPVNDNGDFEENRNH